MKKVSKIKNKWYLVCDGKGTRVVSDRNVAEMQGLNVVIIAITADVAANILLLEKGESGIVA